MDHCQACRLSPYRRSNYRSKKNLLSFASSFDNFNPYTHFPPNQYSQPYYNGITYGNSLVHVHVHTARRQTWILTLEITINPAVINFIFLSGRCNVPTAQAARIRSSKCSCDSPWRSPTEGVRCSGNSYYSSYQSSIEVRAANSYNIFGPGIHRV